MRADGDDLVHEVFDTGDVVRAECLLNGGLVGERDVLLVDLVVSVLVDELPDGLEVGLANLTSDSQLRWVAVAKRTRK